VVNEKVQKVVFDWNTNETQRPPSLLRFLVIPFYLHLSIAIPIHPVRKVADPFHNTQNGGNSVILAKLLSVFRLPVVGWHLPLLFDSNVVAMPRQANKEGMLK